MLRISYAADLAGLNPHLSPEISTDFLSELTMAYLARADADGLPRPELALEIPTRANGGISRDGRTVIYHLRHDARWSDGVPFTAADVVFTTHVVRDPRTNEVHRYGFEEIEQIAAPDPYTIRLRLRRPFAPIAENFFATTGGPCILPKHLLDHLTTINQAPYNALPVGIGPFTYVRWRRGDSVELAANPLYFRGRPKLDRIIFKIIADRNTLLAQMRSHELDLWIWPGRGYYDQLAATPGVRIVEQPGNVVQVDLLDLRSPVLQDPHVRHALLLAVDRERLLRQFHPTLGTLGDAFIPAGNPLHAHLGATPYDPAAARAELERDGWRAGPDGIRVKAGRRLELRVVTTTGTPDLDERIESVRSWYRAVGIALDTRRYPASMLFGPAGAGGLLATGRFDLATVIWRVDGFGDLRDIFACSSRPPRGFNYAFLCDDQLDRAMSATLGDYELNARLRDAAVVQRRLAALEPVVVDYYPVLTYALAGSVRNFNPVAAAPLDDMMDVTISDT